MSINDNSENNGNSSKAEPVKEPKAGQAAGKASQQKPKDVGRVEELATVILAAGADDVVQSLKFQFETKVNGLTEQQMMDLLGLVVLLAGEFRKPIKDLAAITKGLTEVADVLGFKLGVFKEIMKPYVTSFLGSEALYPQQQETDIKEIYARARMQMHLKEGDIHHPGFFAGTYQSATNFHHNTHASIRRLFGMAF